MAPHPRPGAGGPLRSLAQRAGLRQFTHVVDLAPTILEAAGIPAPNTVNGVAQMPFHGASFAHTFTDPKAPEQHTQQYFETVGNRAMYKGGWMLSCRVPRIPWKLDPDTLKRFAPGTWHPENEPCELYDLAADFSQARDLAEPGKLATGGTGRLFVNGKQVAEGKLEHTVPLRFSGYAGMDIGRDNGLPVSPDKIYYLRRPFPFEGTIERVDFELK